jgi:hypothetical protein
MNRRCSSIAAAPVEPEPQNGSRIRPPSGQIRRISQRISASGLTVRWGIGDDAIIVHFNPWLFSGTEQLVEHFFEELSAQLRETGRDRLKTIAGALSRYGKTVGPLAMLPWVGEVARSSKEAAEAIAGALGSEQPSARAQADGLREHLRDLDRRVVVVVDDLDRLQTAEIVDVMRLVRLVGDFPNLVYLLVFDRLRVEAALGDGNAELGRAYLEKMVQVLHRLPMIDPEDLSRLFLDELGKAVGDIAPYHFSQDHFTNLYAFGIRELVETVRDVHRYTNLLPTTLALVGDEVELGDVLALEAIRLFLPDCFDRLVEAREALTVTHDHGRGFDHLREERERLVKAIVDAAGDRQETMEELVKRLFPAAGGYLGGANYGSDWLESWRRDRRVAHPAVLTTYLQRRLPPNEIAAKSVDAVVSALEDRERLDELLKGLDEDQLERLLRRLQDYEKDYPGSEPAVTISVFLEHGQRLSRDRRGMLDFGAHIELRRVVYRLLRGLGPDDVQKAVEATDYPNLSARYDIARMVGHHENSGDKLIPQPVAERIEKEVADMVLAASADEMAQEPDVGVLIGLGRATHQDTMRARVREWSTNDRFFVHLLHGHINVSLSSTSGDAAVQRTVILNWPAVTALLPQDYAASRVAEIEDNVFAEAGDDAATVQEQAKIYAEDPAAGERAIRRFRDGGYEDED